MAIRSSYLNSFLTRISLVWLRNNWRRKRLACLNLPQCMRFDHDSIRAIISFVGWLWWRRQIWRSVFGVPTKHALCTSALDECYRCSDDKLKSIFDELLKRVPATYKCYVKYFQEHEKGDLGAMCPPVDVPCFHASHKADGVEIDLGVPRCIVKSSEYNFSPKRRYQFDDCREQVEVFMGKGMLRYAPVVIWSLRLFRSVG